MIDREEIISLFRLNKSGNKGWMLSELDCPYCGKINHLAIILSERNSFICQKCKEKGSLWKLLVKLERFDLISDKFLSLPKDKVENKILIKDEDKDLNYILPIITPPIGFKRINYHPYLTEERGFLIDQYEQFGIGYTTLDPKLGKTYIIFQVKDKDNNLVGYVGRSILSKNQISKINQKRKEKAILANKSKYKRYLRWINSGGDFGKMIFGCNEIIQGVTKTILVVEGITDKANLDNLLDLRKFKKIKCNSTFSNKVTDFQIKIWEDLGIENIILLYDSDSNLLDINKEMAFKLTNYFNVRVGYQNEGKDPGDFDLNMIIDILEHLESPLDFFKNKVQIDI